MRHPRQAVRARCSDCTTSSYHSLILVSWYPYLATALRLEPAEAVGDSSTDRAVAAAAYAYTDSVRSMRELHGPSGRA